MAMDRQQLLATMVLMGINRLVVTDGKISASCLFQLDTLSEATEDSTSDATFDEQHREKEGGGWWQVWFGGKSSRTTSQFHVATTNDTSSTEQVALHSELTGNVEINFRSDVVDLDKIADSLQIQEIEQKAPAAVVAPAPASTPGFQLPPPPPLPTLPGQPGAKP
jgi:hypothetical protein